MRAKIMPRLALATGLLAAAVVTPSQLDVPGSRAFALGYTNDVTSYRYNSRVADGPKELGPVGDSLIDTRYVSAQIRFRVRQKPPQAGHAELFATAFGEDRGVHVVIDEFGSAFMTIGERASSLERYFLLRLWDNSFDGSLHRLKFVIDQRIDKVLVEADGKNVTLNDPRNGTQLQASQVLLDTSNVVIGGITPNRFDGVIYLDRFATRQDDRLIGLFGIRFALIIFAFALFFSAYLMRLPISIEQNHLE